MIRKQMLKDHDPATCTICRFLAKPCSSCGKTHASYEEAAHCMRKDFAAANQYQKAMNNANS